MLKAYRTLLRPWLGNCCRYEPSCSFYAEQAIQQFSFFKSAWLILHRLLRCHPFCSGGYDPLPQLKSQEFSQHNSQSNGQGIYNGK